MAQIKRIFGTRVAVDAGKEHVGAVIKNRLGAVAVVVIHVQHRNPFQALVAQVLGRQRGVIDKAVTAEIPGPSVVAGWARQRKRGALARDNGSRCAECAVSAAARSQPGPRSQGRAGVETIEAEAGRKIRGLPIAAAVDAGPDTGQDVAGSVLRVQREPVLPGGLQEAEVAWGVDAQQKVVIPSRRVKHQTESALS